MGMDQTREPGILVSFLLADSEVLQEPAYGRGRPLKINMEPQNGSLEDEFPVQLDGFLGSMLILFNFHGCNHA